MAKVAYAPNFRTIFFPNVQFSNISIVFTFPQYAIGTQMAAKISKLISTFLFCLKYHLLSFWILKLCDFDYQHLFFSSF